MNNKPNFIESNESKKHLSKAHKFMEKTQKAVKDALIKTGIATSTMGPIATTSTSTFVPASVNTITAVAPTATTVAKAISLGTAASLLSACGGEENEPDGPINPNKPTEKDTTPPTIDINKSEIDITGGKQIRVEGNQLYIGDILVASRSDNKTKNCNVELSLNGKSISTGATISEEGTLSIKVTDEAGNIKNADIKLNITKNAPSITVNKYEVNIFGGTTVNINNNQLLFGDEVIASWDDEDLEGCEVSLKLNGKDIKSGDTIDEGGKLTLTITNKNKKTSTAEITLTNDAIYGLENLKNTSMQVDQEINLLNGITFANGVELTKTEVEIDGERNTISDPSHYAPDYPGVCNIIFTLKGKNGNTAEVSVDNLNIKPLEYKSIEVNDIKPVDILPIIGQVEAGDKKAYEHIEHLRVAEATRIRDMMWEYGAGNYSPEEYQQLMSRLNTGMMGENPLGYDNYEIVGEELGKPSDHAHAEWFILNTLLKHANLKVINPLSKRIFDVLHNFCKQYPNKINVMGLSVGADVDKEQYNARKINKVKECCEENNLLIFAAGGNIRTENGNLHNKVYQENLSLPDEHSVYNTRSCAHNKNDNVLNIHLLITFGTNKNGDIDQTNEKVESSKFPVGFHNKVLFAGRIFPYKYYEDRVGANTGKYNTSFTNYLNVAITDLCFQMKADIADVDELLEMIRSTALTDYIRFDLNGDGDTDDTYDGQPETQTLQLMNPAGFFKKYLMPTDLPNSLKSDKTISLNKGYYKGVIFDIPGAEVKINGEWVAYNNTNKSLIKNQNPMTLEWRLNGDLCKKLGYKGKNIQGKIVVVDDQWNGLNIDKEFSVNIQ